MVLYFHAKVGLLSSEVANKVKKEGSVNVVRPSHSIDAFGRWANEFFSMHRFGESEKRFMSFNSMLESPLCFHGYTAVTNWPFFGGLETSCTSPFHFSCLQEILNRAKNTRRVLNTLRMSAPVTPAAMLNSPSGAPKPPEPCVAFKNAAFLRSHAGRTTRVVAEFTEFPARVEHAGIRGTFLFFGSARAKSADQFAERKQQLEAAKLRSTASASEKADADRNLAALQKQEWMTHWYAVTEELARLLTIWSLSDEGRRVGSLVSSHFDVSKSSQPLQQPLVVCTGGGPGFMEAGNKGSFEVGGKSMGVSVVLPFEDKMNAYVTPGLDFCMDYFFTRKFWEVFAAKAMICCPGGFGTCDEMFEVLCLMQCNHCPKIPVVLLGGQFWRDVISFEKFDQYGVVSMRDVDSLFFADDAKSAFEHIRKALVDEANEAERAATAGTPPPA